MKISEEIYEVISKEIWLQRTEPFTEICSAEMLFLKIS